MKKVSRKLLALLLILTMVFTLAACGNSDKADKETGTDIQAGDDTDAADSGDTDAGDAAATEPPATPTPVPDKYEAFDFGGRTVKIATWYDVYYTSDHSSIEEDPKLTDAETAQMKLDNVRRIEAKYKCKIQFVNMGWSGIMNSVSTSITAGTPECDIYMVDLQFGFPAVFNGLAQELSAVALEGSDLLGAHEILEPMKIDVIDGTYLFRVTEPATYGIFMGYNATMIQDLGLDDPQELYKNGQWTWDKMAQMAKAGTRDLENDGITDTYGFSGITSDLTAGLVMNNGGSIAGSTTEGLSSTPVKEALEFIDRLYNKDKSARPFEGTWEDNRDAWTNGNIMFWTAQNWSLKEQADNALSNGEEIPFEYHVVPYPTGPSGDGTIYSPYAGNWYMIPAGVEDPGQVLQIFEEYNNWHGGDPEYRDDITNFESCFLTVEDVDMALSACQNFKFDPYFYLSPYFDYSGNIWWPLVVRKDQTVAQIIESQKLMLQSALDNFVYRNINK